MLSFLCSTVFSESHGQAAIALLSAYQSPNRSLISRVLAMVFNVFFVGMYLVIGTVTTSLFLRSGVEYSRGMQAYVELDHLLQAEASKWQPGAEFRFQLVFLNSLGEISKKFNLFIDWAEKGFAVLLVAVVVADRLYRLLIPDGRLYHDPSNILCGELDLRASFAS